MNLMRSMAKDVIRVIVFEGPQCTKLKKVEGTLNFYLIRLVKS